MFRVGQRVKLVGLISRPDLNGKKGRLLLWDAKAKRWAVKLSKKAGACRLRLENAQAVDTDGESEGEGDEKKQSEHHHHDKHQI